MTELYYAWDGGEEGFTAAAQLTDTDGAPAAREDALHDAATALAVLAVKAAAALAGPNEADARALTLALQQQAAQRAQSLFDEGLYGALLHMPAPPEE